MIISRYGVRLIRISEEHLELIRYWRNSEKIRNVMEYREFITRQMQQAWFRSLDMLRDFYFIIESEGNYIGLIHVAKIDWKQLIAQSGLFIWDDKYIGSPVPVMASINLLDTCFGFFSLQTIEAKVKRDNHTAIDYNKHLGFEETSAPEKTAFMRIYLTKENYMRAAALIKHRLGHESRSLPNIFIPVLLYQQLHEVGVSPSESVLSNHLIVE